MELKATNHSYYCSESNYYVDGMGSNNFGRCEYDTWQEFKNEWIPNDEYSNGLDDDFNHCFRFDINQIENEDGNLTGKFELWLFFILQRKGIYRPVWIHNITENDMPEIENFLKERWNYLKYQWSEFSEQNL